MFHQLVDLQVYKQQRQRKYTVYKPQSPPTDLDVSETASIVISDSDMALFTDVVKRGKKRTQKTNARIAPPAVAVVKKTGKSSAITGRGVGIGIEAAKRSGRLASVFASRLAPESRF